MAANETVTNTKLLDELASNLQSDRLIKIYVGSQEFSYHVQEQLLVNCSGYFAKALRFGVFVESQTGTFWLHDDSEEAWKVLLYWLTHHDHPSLCDRVHMHLLIKCWILGDKYDIKLFQDDAMLFMLEIVRSDEGYATCITEDMIRETFENTAEGSKLRDLVTEEAFITLWMNHERPPEVLRNEQLASLDGLGFLPLYIQKEKEWHARKGAPKWLYKTFWSIWKEYMCGPAEKYEMSHYHRRDS